MMWLSLGVGVFVLLVGLVVPGFTLGLRPLYSSMLAFMGTEPETKLLTN